MSRKDLFELLSKLAKDKTTVIICSAAKCIPAYIKAIEGHTPDWDEWRNSLSNEFFDLIKELLDNTTQDVKIAAIPALLSLGQALGSTWANANFHTVSDVLTQIDNSGASYTRHTLFESLIFDVNRKIRSVMARNFNSFLKLLIEDDLKNRDNICDDSQDIKQSDIEICSPKSRSSSANWVEETSQEESQEEKNQYINTNIVRCPSGSGSRSSSPAPSNKSNSSEKSSGDHVEEEKKFRRRRKSKRQSTNAKPVLQKYITTSYI